MSELNSFMKDFKLRCILVKKNLDIFDSYFERKNPYKMTFKSIDTEVSYKCKYDQIMKVRLSIELSSLEQIKRLDIEKILKDIEC